MNNAQPAAPPPDSGNATRTSSSEPEAPVQPEPQPEAPPEAPDAPHAAPSAQEDAGDAEPADLPPSREEPGEIVAQHDQAIADREAADVSPEPLPVAADAAQSGDGTDNGADTHPEQAVDDEAGPAAAGDEPVLEAEAGAVAADEPTATADDEETEDNTPDSALDRTERAELTVSADEEASGNGQETTDAVVPAAVVPDSGARQNGHGTEDSREQPSPGPQQHAETAENAAHLHAELLAGISAGMEEQTDKLTRLSAALFAMDKRFNELSSSVAQVSQHLQKVSEETEQTVNWTESVAITSSLSRWFLVLSIIILAALLGGMGYLASNQYQLMRQQSNAAQAAAAATELQIKRMAEFDKRFAELVGGAIKNERETINKESVAGKINKLRGGAAERRILRKSSGDWLIPNGKTEELVTDPEIIDALNLAFEKSGRPLITPPSLPPHKTVCILKPNGKGGTEVMLTRETMP